MVGDEGRAQPGALPEDRVAAGGAHSHRIFSPQLCSLERLEATLSEDRRAVAARILAGFGASPVETAHGLLVGPSGSGKTHVLAYIHKTLALRGDVLVLSVSEELRGLVSLLDFLVACLQALGLDTDYLFAHLCDGDPALATERAQGIFRDAAGGKPTLLIVDNVDDAFECLSPGALRQLHGLLQDQPSVSVLASSATPWPKSDAPGFPFREFFTVHSLAPLDRRRAGAYLRTLALVNGDMALATALDREHARASIDAIWDLAGGNHRLLAMAGLFLTAENLAEPAGPLAQMADCELLPYYQQRLDRLSPQQFKILRCIAGQHGRALNVNEIARNTFLAPRTVSRQLYDLRNGAYVARTRLGRESYHEVRDPLLRLIFEIKRGDERALPAAVTLLKRWHDLEDLRLLEPHATDRTAGPYYRLTVEALDAFSAGPGPSTAEGSQHPDASGLGPHQHPASQTAIGEALVNEGDVLARLGREAEALAAHDDAARRGDTGERPELLGAIAAAVSRKAKALARMGRYQDALALYDEVVGHFALGERPELLGLVAMAHTNKARCLAELGRHGEEIGEYDEVVRDFGHSSEPELMAWVGRALTAKGDRLARLGRHDEAQAVYDDVVQRFEHMDGPEAVGFVAAALLGKVALLDDQGRPDAAVAVYDDLAERFESEGVALPWAVPTALVNKGSALADLGRYDEALAAYDDVAQRVSYGEDLQALDAVAVALVGKATVLADLGRLDEAVATYDDAAHRFTGSRRAAQVLAAVRALVNAGSVLSELGRPDEALAAYDQAVERSAGNTRAEVQAEAAGALFSKGVVLGALGRLDEAAAAYAELVRRFAEAEDPDLREMTAMAQLLRGNALGDLGRVDEAVVAYDDVVAGHSASGVPELQEMAVAALTNKATALAATGRTSPALEVCDAALRLRPANVLTIALRASLLLELDLKEEGLQYAILAVDVFPRGGLERSVIAAQMIGLATADAGLLEHVAQLFSADGAALARGLAYWLRKQLPLSQADAEGLDAFEDTLRTSFAGVRDARPILDMLSAARRDAMGDRKALLDVPLELRRLIEQAKEEGKGAPNPTAA